ncbi:hypothetical protein K1719_042816 [Acacia pycnantha]|nr:hypothetical protein K1719_042816 [Acacia pycnantha]
MADGHLFNNIALSGRGAPSQEAINLGVRTKDGLSYKFTGFRDQVKISRVGVETTRVYQRLHDLIAPLRRTGENIFWRDFMEKTGGGKAIEVDKADIMGVTWMKVPRSNQLGVRTKDGLSYKFTGFHDQDVANLNSFFQNTCGITPDEKHLFVSGRNWGDVDLNGM